VAVIVCTTYGREALHRHRPYLDLWEWILWTALIRSSVAIGALFLFDFFLVLGTLIAGWPRWSGSASALPAHPRVYQQKLARSNASSRSAPTGTIRTKPARATRRRQ
jgi:hypothetical protein